MQVQPMQWFAGGGARHVRLNPAGRVRARAGEPAAKIRADGGGSA